MRRGSNNRETPKGVPSSKNNRQLVTCRPFRDSCMRTKPNSYRHGSYRLGRVYRQGSKTLFHAYGPWTANPVATVRTLDATELYDHLFVLPSRHSCRLAAACLGLVCMARTKTVSHVKDPMSVSHVKDPMSTFR